MLFVPSVVIYPGDTLEVSNLKELDVTNSKLSGNYARSVKDVLGLVAKRTLLPNRVISLSALRRSYAVTRGSNVRIVFKEGLMMISASGICVTDASVGDVIRVRKSDTGVVVSGTVMTDGTVHVIER